MPYVEPTTRATGYLITAADWNQDVVANVSFLANPPACRVRRTTTQSINSATNTAVAFDSERYDTDSMHSTVTNTSRITLNTAGLYIFWANLSLAGDTDYSTLDVWFSLNGATTIGNMNNVNPGTAALSRIFNGMTPWKCAAADYVEVFVRQVNASAGANNVEIGAEFAAIWQGLG